MQMEACNQQREREKGGWVGFQIWGCQLWNHSWNVGTCSCFFIPVAGRHLVLMIFMCPFQLNYIIFLKHNPQEGLIYNWQVYYLGNKDKMVWHQRTLFTSVSKMLQYKLFVFFTCRGIVASILVFLCFGVTQAKDGPFSRPHPGNLSHLNYSDISIMFCLV